MRLRWPALIFLLLLAATQAQEPRENYNQDALVEISLDINSTLHVTSTKQNAVLESLAADLNLLPQDDRFQALFSHDASDMSTATNEQRQDRIIL